MEYRWKNIVTFLLFVVSIVIVVPWEDKPFLGNQGFVLGLDLQGGTQMLLRLDYGDQDMTPSEMNQATQQAQDILSQRINQYGLTQPRIQKTGREQILVQIPGLENNKTRLERVKNILRTTGNLKFYLRAPKVDRSKAGKPDPNNPYKNAPEGTIWLPLSDDADSGAGSSDYPGYMLLEAEPKLVGRHVDNATTNTSMRGEGYQISLNLTNEGGQKFAQVTRENVNRQLAITLDGKLLSAPNIEEPITGGRASITGNYQPEEAKVLTTALNSGQLRAPIRIMHENTVGPSLGQASIERGKWAILSALGIIILFMILYYWVLGLVVSFVLVLNLLLLGALLLLLQATLTLPGIAGIILTVGMAVDASVIIFERIREESEKDQSARKAFETAWNNAFYAVFDANITTLIAAIILYYFGSQSIRGFATTLLLGVLTTLFTVFFSEKAIIRGLLGVGLIERFKQMRWFTGTNFTFLNKARGMFVVSVVLVVCSVGVFAYGASQGGTIFGLDFMGGQLMNLRFEKNVEASEIRNTLESVELDQGFRPYAGVEVQKIETGPVEEASGTGASASGSTNTSDTKKQKGSSSIFYTYQLRLKGSRVDRVVDDYLRRDLSRIFEGDEAKNTVTSVEFGDNRAVFQLQNPQKLNDVQRKIDLFQYEDTLIRPYEDLTVTIPGQEEPAGTAEARQFEIEVTNELNQSYLRHDLLARFGDVLAPLREVEIAGSNPFAFRIALPDKQPVEKVQSGVHSVFSELGIEVKPLVEPVAGADDKQPEQARHFRVTSHEDVERSVRDQYSDIIENLDKQIGLSGGPFGGRVVSMSAPVADSFKRDAFWAISLSWVAILLYLALRFQFAYGVGAVVALVHDVIVCVGTVALVDLLLPSQLGINLDIGMASLAAFLTVVGYSVNDSIVTFDRIRELIQNSRKKTLGTMIDESINLNLSRTVLTSVTTFLAAGILFAFTANTGTDVASFAFPILIGVVIGTYSSMFLASPLLVYAPGVGKPEDTRASRMNS